MTTTDSRKWVHLHAVGRYTWCERAWMTRRHGRDKRILQTVDHERGVTCPDCLAALAAELLKRSNV